MEDDQFAAAERILLDIETVFKKDPKLKEFDFIPVTINQNKSPVIHVDHCLGLELWCVRHVYCYVYHHIFDSRKNGKRFRKTEPSVMSRWLLGGVLINPDVSTFWNMRRELLGSGRLDVRAELHLTAVVLSRKPKSGEAFAYRRTLVGRLAESRPGLDAALLLEGELAVCGAAADRCPANYHAWGHRAWSLGRLGPLSSAPLAALQGEWALSEQWVSSHVSDHSGMHYRQFLHKRLTELAWAGGAAGDLAEGALRSLARYVAPHELRPLRPAPLPCALGVAAAELALNADLVLRFPGHEALWCHRRFLVASLAEALEGRGRGRAAPPDGDPDTERLCLLVSEASSWHERALLRQCAGGDHQHALATKHRTWLGHILGVDLPDEPLPCL